jgi:hypothetical protein
MYWKKGKFGGQDYNPNEDRIRGGGCDERR